MNLHLIADCIDVLPVFFSEKLNNFLNDETTEQNDRWTFSQRTVQNRDFSATSLSSYGSTSEQNNAHYASVTPETKRAMTPDYNGAFSRSESSNLCSSYNSAVKVHVSDDIPAPDYDQNDGPVVADVRTAKPQSTFNGVKYDVGNQLNSTATVAVNGTHRSSKQVPSPPMPPTFNISVPSSSHPPPPPPPPPPPMPASFATVPILDLSKSSTGVPTPAASSGMPRQVQKQLEETRKRDETHAALLAAVQRRRNLLNTVDGDQVGLGTVTLMNLM